MMRDDLSSPQNETKLADLRRAVDAGLAELDTGLGVDVSVDELVTEVFGPIDSAP